MKFTEYLLIEQVKTVIGSFDPKQIAILKKTMSTVAKFDPSKKSVIGMTNLIGMLNPKQLKKIVGADIKFISDIAQSRLDK
jgi:hypothetical protein